MTLINDLNNDCLREILLYLEANERTKLRTVCKKWASIVDDCWREVRALAIMRPEYRDESNRLIKEVAGTGDRIGVWTYGQKLIAGVMKRCGDVITTLTDWRHEKNNSSLPLAIKHCTNIEQFFTIVKSAADDRHISQLLPLNKKLKNVRLIIKYNNAKTCFRRIPTDSLEYIQFVVDNCDHPSPAILIGQKQVISRCSSLRELMVDYFDNELVELIGQKITLESLDLKFILCNGVTESSLNHILALKNLRTLILESSSLGSRKQRATSYCPPVTDDFLMALSENLPLLEVIEIDSATKMTNKGFKSLASLKKLRELTIAKCPTITDEFLVLFYDLDELSVVSCPVRDEGVIKLLEKAHTMRELCLEQTLITNKTLIAAINATKKRDNGICLKLYDDGTKTRPEYLTETSPLLEISNQDAEVFQLLTSRMLY